jgi:hypothetical protein
MANNVFSNNANENYLADLTRLSQIADDFSVEAAPRAEWLGPSRAMMGQAVQFDARGSRDLAGRELHFNWQAGEFSGDGPLFKPVFAKPGVYRLGLTVDNGVLADLAWCDLLVTDEVKDEIGTEGQAGLWGYAVEGNDGHGTMSFEDDLDAVAGKTSLRFRIDPKLGAATAIFPRGRDADWDFTGKTRVRFWLQFENPNQEGFQNPGPVLILYSKDGPIKIQPDKDHNLLNEVKLIGNKGRHTWMLFEVPLAGGEGWERKDSGNADLHHIAGLGLAFASGGNDPITIWLDGLAAE